MTGTASGRTPPDRPTREGAVSHASPRRLEALDALRALVAIAVMLFHYEGMLGSLSFDLPVERLYFRYAMLGVELFFIVSGFVILMTLEKAASVRGFLLGRAARIYPAYWLSVVFATLVLVWGDHHVIWRAIVNITMLQSFLHVSGLISPYWTLAYELWFYVLMALVLRFGLGPHLPMIAGAWLILACIVRVLGFHSSGLPGIISMLPFGHLFIAGMMIYRLTNGQTTLATQLVLLGCAGYSCFGRQDWSHVSGQVYFVVNAVFMAAVYLVACGHFRAIATPWLSRIGQASYSFYLLHVPIGLLCVFTAQNVGYPHWAGLVFAVPASFVVADICRRYVELPGQRAIKSLGANRALATT